MATQTKPITGRIIGGLVLYAVLGALVVLWIPEKGLISTQNSQLRLTALVLVALNGLVLWLAKQDLKFSPSRLWLALAYNALIIGVKFVLSPATLASRSELFTGYTLTGLMVMALYLLGFWLIYAFFSGRLDKVVKVPGAGEERKFLFVSGLFILINLVRIGLFALPVFRSSSAAGYLNNIYGAKGLALSTIVFLIILAATEAFDRAKSLDSPTDHQLSHFFWVGASLIFIDHVLWVLMVTFLFTR